MRERLSIFTVVSLPYQLRQYLQVNALIARDLSGFTCTSSLTMNERFQYRTRPPSAVLKNFEFIVSERVQVNLDNSRAMSALTFLLFKLNTL